MISHLLRNLVYQKSIERRMNPGVMTQLFQFILGLAVLILLHELGHFLVARLLHIEVEEFGIGFPPRMAKLFEAGGTVYSLNWIPLGGFVRPKGENDPSIPGSLAAASPWARLGFLVAGPIMNILIGIILAIGLFYSMGEPISNQVKIAYVDPSSPAATAGLATNDMITAINGQKIDSMQTVIDIIGKNLDKPVQISVQRGSETKIVTLTPRSNPPPNQGAIGIRMTNPTRPISFLTAMERGTQAALDYIHNVLALPLRLIRGTAAPEEGRLLGYRGMFEIYQQLDSPLYFFMAISMSLGIFNLLPIPALDGGRILLTLPEILLRKRIPPKYENMIHLIGFTLLLILLIYINLQDFINPVQLPK